MGSARACIAVEELGTRAQRYWLTEQEKQDSSHRLAVGSHAPAPPPRRASRYAAAAGRSFDRFVRTARKRWLSLAHAQGSTSP